MIICKHQQSYRRTKATTTSFVHRLSDRCCCSCGTISSTVNNNYNSMVYQMKLVLSMMVVVCIATIQVFYSTKIPFIDEQQHRTSTIATVGVLEGLLPPPPPPPKPNNPLVLEVPIIDEYYRNNTTTMSPHKLLQSKEEGDDVGKRIHIINGSTTEEGKDQMQQQKKSKSYPNYSYPYHQCHLSSTNQTILTFPQTPSFIIAGVHKGGTTALYALLNIHPNISTSFKVEPHFFDRHNNQLKKKSFQNTPIFEREDELCRIRYEYATSMWGSNLKQVERIQSGTIHASFEKTPSYITDRKIPLIISQVCPWIPQIIISLRNPIDRAFASINFEHEEEKLKMLKTNDSNTTSQPFDYMDIFNQRIYEQVEEMRSLGLTRAPSIYEYLNRTSSSTADTRTFVKRFQYAVENIPIKTRIKRTSKKFRLSDLGRGLYAEQMVPWLKKFSLQDQKMKIVWFDEFQKSPKGVVDDLCDFVGAPRHTFTSNQLHFDYSPNKLSFQRSSVQNRTKQKLKYVLDPMTRQYLQDFFQPYNYELSNLLQEEIPRLWK